MLVGCDWNHSTTTSSGGGHAGPTARKPRVHRVLVTVVDGDTHRRVAHARVRIGNRSAVSNRYGIAKIPLRQRAPLVTVASKKGYATRAVRLAFHTHPKSTIRIYQPRLQWSMYGAGPRRSNAQPAIKLRPPFRLVWSRALGGLVEFPAVVADGIAYVGNARGTIRALDMRTGDVVWRHDTPHGKMASSPAVWGTTLVVHGMDGHVWVLRRSDGKLLWHYTAGSPIESSPVVIGKGIDVFGAWNGTVTALDLRTHRVRWRRYFGCKITSSAAYADSTIYLGDYCGRLLALRAANGALRWSRAVNGRVYGTPAVSAGRVFVPSSTGGSLTAFSTRGDAPLVARDRLVRLLVAGGRARPRLLRLVQRRLLRAPRAERPHAVDAPDRRPHLRRGRRRRRRRVRRLVRAPDPRRQRRDGPRRARLPARRVCAGVRWRQAPAPARVLARLRRRGAMKRYLIAGAARARPRCGRRRSSRGTCT